MVQEKNIIDSIEIVEQEKTVTGYLPDIDTDFESERRDDVKKYMESKY